MRPSYLALFSALLLAGALSAQTENPTPKMTLEQVLGDPTGLIPQLPRAQWIPGSDALCLIDTLEVEMPAAEGEEPKTRKEMVALRHAFDGSGRSELFRSADMSQALMQAMELERPPLPPGRLPGFGFVDAERLRLETPSTLWYWKFAGNAEGESGMELRYQFPAKTTASAFAKDDAAAAFIADHQLLVVDKSGEKQLTKDGVDGDIVYGGAAHRAEFGIHDGLWWDESGRYLAFSREDMTPNAIYPYVDYRSKPAEPLHGRYPMAGSSHSKVTIGVYDRQAANLVYLEHDPEADLYWTNVTFGLDGSRIYVALVARSQDHCELVEFDSATGKRLRTLLEERDEQWVEPEHGPIFLPSGDGFLWFSPRDGYRHLYRYSMDGELQGQLTKGAYDVRSLLGFSTDGNQAFVMASDTDPDAAFGPLTMFCWRVAVDGDPSATVELERISDGIGWHDCVLSDEGAVLDSWSSRDNPGRLQVWLPDGSRHPVAAATLPVATQVTGPHRYFKVDTADGATLYGHAIPPKNPDPNKPSPILLYVYGGPHSQLVKYNWSGGAQLWLQYLAQQGYIVVRLDNRGTDNRGIEFSQAIHRDASAYEVADQLAAVSWVTKNFDFADPDKVGVHGWSYGGYMTLRLMEDAPELFTCGIAGAPVTDWSRYETGYTERYMDTPEENPEGYEDASVLNKVDQIQGRLLLIHGTDDKTVMLSHSMAFINQAIAKGLLIDHMQYPMGLHGIRGAQRVHLYRLMTRFLEEQLPAPTLP